MEHLHSNLVMVKDACESDTVAIVSRFICTLIDRNRKAHISCSPQCVCEGERVERGREREREREGV